MTTTNQQADSKSLPTKEKTANTHTELIHGRPILSDTDHLTRMAKALSGSALCPAQYKGKPQDAFVAILAGAEVGFQPMQALKSICVINGRPSIYGDGLSAVAYASGKLKHFSEESDTDKAGEVIAVTVRIERTDVEGIREFRFSRKDAERAGLWGRRGPWSDYPARMLSMRARGFAFRDCFADYLAGLHVAEEQQDIPAGRFEDIPPDREISFEDEPQSDILDAEYQSSDAGKMVEPAPSQMFAKMSECIADASEEDLPQLAMEIPELLRDGHIDEHEHTELMEHLDNRRRKLNGKDGLF